MQNNFHTNSTDFAEREGGGWEEVEKNLKIMWTSYMEDPKCDIKG